MRVVDEEGNMLGVLPINEAIKEAQARNLDLVELSPNAEPPVCKILDYGKYKYELKKKSQTAKKKQKVVELKEIKIGLNIADHDYQTKMRSLVKFIEAGNKVKISLRFKGREITHQDLAMNLFTKIIQESAEIAKVEFEPKLDGKQILMVIAPKI